MLTGQREYISVQKYKFDMFGDAVFEWFFAVFCAYGIYHSDLDLRLVDGHDQLAGPKFSHRYAHWRSAD